MPIMAAQRRVTSYLVLISILFLSVYATEEENNVVGRKLMSIDSEEMASNMQNLLRELPRFDFSFQKINNTFAPLEIQYYEVRQISLLISYSSYIQLNSSLL
jgi:hypothetical protein